MSQDSIALRQNLAVEFDHRDIARGVQFGNLGLLDFWEFLEAVAHIFVGDTGVFPQQTDHLPAAARFEVEVMEGGHAADGVVGGGRGAELLG